MLLGWLAVGLPGFLSAQRSPCMLVALAPDPPEGTAVPAVGNVESWSRSMKLTLLRTALLEAGSPSVITAPPALAFSE